MGESPIFLCPMGTCDECDRHRRIEQEAQCPLRGPYKAGWLSRFWHWLHCGGGWSEYQPSTGASSCGFCGFLYEVRRATLGGGA